ncbi:hypothetical protein HDU76_004205, partial [Blyttiomyces sp. JEL0837]
MKNSGRYNSRQHPSSGHNNDPYFGQPPSTQAVLIHPQVITKLVQDVAIMKQQMQKYQSDIRSLNEIVYSQQVELAASKKEVVALRKEVVDLKSERAQSRKVHVETGVKNASVHDNETKTPNDGEALFTKVSSIAVVASSNSASRQDQNSNATSQKTQQPIITTNPPVQRSAELVTPSTPSTSSSSTPTSSGSSTTAVASSPITSTKPNTEFSVDTLNNLVAAKRAQLRNPGTSTTAQIQTVSNMVPNLLTSRGPIAGFTEAKTPSTLANSRSTTSSGSSTTPVVASPQSTSSSAQPVYHPDFIMINNAVMAERANPPNSCPPTTGQIPTISNKAIGNSLPPRRVDSDFSTTPSVENSITPNPGAISAPAETD